MALNQPERMAEQVAAQSVQGVAKQRTRETQEASHALHASQKRSRRYSDGQFVVCLVHRFEQVRAGLSSSVYVVYL
jgi:hypothetical protein